MYKSAQIQELSKKTTGIGIVCGLEVLLSEYCSLTITKGYGFTSKGILIDFPEKEFNYYRLYDQPVRGLISAGSDIEVWELLTDRINDSIPLTPQIINDDRFIDGKVLFLYVEDPNSAIIKPLMIDKADLWEILKQKFDIDTECLPISGVTPEDTVLFDCEDEDPLIGQNLFCAINRNSSLSPIHCMRFGFATDESLCEPENREFKIFKKKVEDPDDDNAQLFNGTIHEYVIIIEDCLGKLQKAFIKLHSKPFYDILPEQQRNYLNLYFTFLSGKRWPPFKSEPERKVFIQHFYGLIRDLIDTYNEIVHEFCMLMADCCPDDALFPYHLLLGEAVEDVVFGSSIFRNHFRQPPIYNGNQQRFQKIRFLHWRMVMQIKNFFIPNIESSELAEGHYTQIDRDDTPPELLATYRTNLEDIKIIPSYDLHLPLGERAIPFYYYVSSDNNSIHHFWSFEKTYCCKTSELLSYHAEGPDSYGDNCAIQRPLAYRTYPHSFYRIEGVIGQKIQEITAFNDHIDELKLRMNLDFKHTSLSYEEFFSDWENDADYQIANTYLGAEHIAGIIEGSSFITLYIQVDGEIAITANFWVPHRIPELDDSTGSSI